MMSFIPYVVRIWRVTIGAMLLAVVLITTAQVFARYVLNDSLVWADEANRLLYVWLILIAAAGASHMRIGLIADRPKLSKVLTPFAVVAALFGLGLLAWGGWRLQSTFAFDYYITLNLSKSWYFLASVIGAVLWFFALVYRSFSSSFKEDGEV